MSNAFFEKSFVCKSHAPKIHRSPIVGVDSGERLFAAAPLRPLEDYVTNNKYAVDHKYFL
jgi:hypothetical protein